MTPQTPNRKPRSTGRAAAFVVGLAALLVTVLASASPARAGDEFRRGFENELGRIAAHHVAGFGALLLHAGFEAHAHHAARPAYGPPHFVKHRVKHRAVRHHRHHRRHAHRHHAHHRSHRRDHRHHASCGLEFEHRVSVRRHH